MVNFYKTINEAFDKRYDSNTKKPLTEASAAHAHPDMSKKEGSISSMILSNKDRIDSATSLQDLRAVVEDILSPLEGNAKVTEINGRLRAMKDHVKALQYIYNIILKGDNLGTIKTGKAKERSKNESFRRRRVNESKRKLKEAASGTFNPDREYDWYEDGDVHPFLDIFNNALDELGLWSEPSIQGGNGYDYFYTQEGSKDAGGVDFGIEADFMNDLFQEMKGHSWSEIEDAIAEFVGDHAEYPDDYDEDEEEYEDEEENLYARSANQLLPKFKKYLNKKYDCDVRYESGEYYVYVTLKQRPSVNLCRLLASTLVLMVRDSGLDINDKSTSDKAWNDVFDKIINYTNARSGYNVIPFRSLEDLSIYKGKDCSYLSEVRPGEDLLTTYIFTYPIQNGSFKDYPYMMLLYDNTRRDYTVIGPNYRADYIYQGDAMDDLESKLKSAQANESFRRRRVNESARRSRTTKKKIR